MFLRKGKEAKRTNNAPENLYRAENEKSDRLDFFSMTAHFGNFTDFL